MAYSPPELDTRPLPVMTAGELAIHREKCRRAAAEYERMNAPEAREERQQKALAEGETWMAMLRAKYPNGISSEPLQEMTWANMVEAYLK